LLRESAKSGGNGRLPGQLPDPFGVNGVMDSPRLNTWMTARIREPESAHYGAASLAPAEQRRGRIAFWSPNRT
jgi:hypothetical protein